jgi:hypothetical protein
MKSEDGIRWRRRAYKINPSMKPPMPYEAACLEVPKEKRRRVRNREE